MIDFTIFNEKTGEMIALCSAQSLEEAAIHFADNEDFDAIEGHYEPSQWRMDLETMKPVPKAATLEEEKAAAWARVKRKRQKVEAGGIQTPFGPVQTDSNAIARLQVLALCAMTFQHTTDFTFADNSRRQISAEELGQIMKAIGDHYAAAHTRAQEFRETIDAAEDAGLLEILDIDAGWPANMEKL